MRERETTVTISEGDLRAFGDFLYQNEKAKATVKKYLFVMEKFKQWLEKEWDGACEAGTMSKQAVLEYRSWLQQSLKAQTVNNHLSAINSYLEFSGNPLCKVKLLKVQRKAFIEESRELSQAEYKRLLKAARDNGDERLYLIMETLGSTGIRIGELPFITVEAARKGSAEISLKNKTRVVMLQKQLRQRLLKFARNQGINEGYLFRTRSGRVMDRSNICHAMKRLCEAAHVCREKVFPHNLRHLFARMFYALEKDLAHLADILGHSRLETTRLYVAVSAKVHESMLKKMHLVME